jgi:DNA polymerase (family 10)
MHCDLRIVPDESFGSALQYFTGSKDHNIGLRTIAIQKGLKLNEYGLFKGSRQIAGRTEKEIYKILGLAWIPPELRENWGELEAARKGQLPDLIGYGDLKGDLQVHTNWTDGKNSILEMSEAAKQTGLEYIAITDHTKSLAMANGLDGKGLERQAEEIGKANDKIEGIKILKGAEVNISKDGSLDVADNALEKLDVVGAAIHSHFNLPKEEQTRRIITAMRNPNVDILFHPTGRIIKQREAYAIDISKVIDLAVETKTVLEVDAFPDRLDLHDEYIKLAVQEGCKISIDSDAHNTSHLQLVKFGIAQARRGWARAQDVVNSNHLKEFLALLKT